MQTPSKFTLNVTGKLRDLTSVLLLQLFSVFAFWSAKVLRNLCRVYFILMELELCCKLITVIYSKPNKKIEFQSSILYFIKNLRTFLEQFQIN